MVENKKFIPNSSIMEFMRVDKLHHACVDSKISALGLGLHRNQHVMLMYLNRSEKNISQKDIAEHFGISAAAVAGTLKSLETDGYIKRIVDINDTRRNIVEITAKGLEIISKSEEVFEFVDKAMLEGLEKSELEILEGCLKKISDNLIKITKEREEK